MRFRPRSSGGLVHSLAQCPTWPQRAHLLRDMIFFLDQRLGAEVRRFLNLLFTLNVVVRVCELDLFLFRPLPLLFPGGLGR